MLRRLFPNLFKVEGVKWLGLPIAILFVWSIYCGLVDYSVNPGVTDPASNYVKPFMRDPRLLRYQAGWYPCRADGLQFNTAGAVRAC